MIEIILIFFFNQKQLVNFTMDNLNIHECVDSKLISLWMKIINTGQKYFSFKNIVDDI